MEEIDFSLILPTRGRVIYFKRLLDSIERTTSKKDKIEVLICVDNDDEKTIEFLKDISQGYSLKFFVRDRQEDMTNGYYNWLAHRTVGNNIMAVNDDAWFKTQGWDDIIRSKIKKSRWSIYLVDVFDDQRNINNNWNFPSFPMISRKGMNVLGFFFLPHFRGWYADQLLCRVYKDIGRIISALEVNLGHDRIEDECRKKMESLWKEDAGTGRAVNIGGHCKELLKAGQHDKGPSKLGRISKAVNVLVNG